MVEKIDKERILKKMKSDIDSVDSELEKLYTDIKNKQFVKRYPNLTDLETISALKEVKNFEVVKRIIDSYELKQPFEHIRGMKRGGGLFKKPRRIDRSYREEFGKEHNFSYDEFVKEYVYNIVTDNVDKVKKYYGFVDKHDDSVHGVLMPRKLRDYLLLYLQGKVPYYSLEEKDRDFDLKRVSYYKNGKEISGGPTIGEQYRAEIDILTIRNKGIKIDGDMIVEYHFLDNERKKGDGTLVKVFPARVNPLRSSEGYPQYRLRIANFILEDNVFLDKSMYIGRINKLKI